MLTAITHKNEQALIQWYENNKQQLQNHFTKAAVVTIERDAQTGLNREQKQREIENTQIHLEKTRRETLKAQERTAAQIWCAIARLESKRRLPLKQQRSLYRQKRQQIQNNIRDKRSKQMTSTRQTQQIEAQVIHIQNCRKTQVVTDEKHQQNQN